MHFKAKTWWSTSFGVACEGAVPMELPPLLGAERLVLVPSYDG